MDRMDDSNDDGDVDNVDDGIERWRRVFKSELPIGVHSLMDGGCRQRHQRSLPAATVAVLFVMGRVSRSASPMLADASGGGATTKRWWCQFWKLG